MSLADWLFNPGGQTQEEADANIAREQDLYNQRLQQREAEGTIDPATDAADQAYIMSGVYVPDSVNAAAAQGFVDGAKDGLNQVTGAINSTLSGVVGSVWKSIPLSLWLLGAVGLFLYLGGLDWLKNKLKTT